MNWSENEVKLPNQDIEYWLARVRKDSSHLMSKAFWADAIRNLYITDKIDEHFGRKNKISILDIPSGNSPIFEFFTGRKMTFEYHGVELYHERVNRTRRRMMSVLRDIFSRDRIFQMSAQSFFDSTPLDRQYNIILCLDGPEHLVKTEIDLRRLISNFEKLLFHHGLLILSTPRARENGELHHPYCHRVEFSLSEIREALSPFEILEIHGYRMQYSENNEKLLDREMPWGHSLPWPIKSLVKTWDRPGWADSCIWIAKLP